MPNRKIKRRISWEKDWATFVRKEHENDVFLYFTSNDIEASTTYQGYPAYLSDNTPHWPKSNTWAKLETATFCEGEREDFYLLTVSPLVSFRVLYWFNMKSRELCSQRQNFCFSSFAPAEQCEWMEYPDVAGEYLCSFFGQEVYERKLLRSHREAKEWTELQVEQKELVLSEKH